MRGNPLTVDLVIAVIVAAVVMIVSPGVAVTGMLALAVIAVCGISFVVGRRRRGPRQRRRPRPR